MERVVIKFNKAGDSFDLYCSTRFIQSFQNYGPAALHACAICELTGTKFFAFEENHWRDHKPYRKIIKLFDKLEIYDAKRIMSLRLGINF